MDKKYFYWPNYIDVNHIRYHFLDKPIGSVDELLGDIYQFHLFGIKEVYHDILFIYTYMVLTWVGK